MTATMAAHFCAKVTKALKMIKIDWKVHWVEIMWVEPPGPVEEPQNCYVIKERTLDLESGRGWKNRHTELKKACVSVCCLRGQMKLYMMFYNLAIL